MEDQNEDSDEDYWRINKMSKEEQLKAMDVPEDTFVFDTQLLGTGALDDLHTKSIFQATGTQYIATNLLKPIKRGDVSKTSEESKIQRQDSLSDLFE